MGAVPAQADGAGRCRRPLVAVGAAVAVVVVGRAAWRRAHAARAGSAEQEAVFATAVAVERQSSIEKR